MIRFNPSNSSNRIGGGGSLGERRITEDSTWGGGRKFPEGSASERSTSGASRSREQGEG